ncbi:hypothetical protein N3Z16_07680 [Candidatus Megaera polyxenophila]|uniref:hypothetical protein n=1 Tax=Candidatus Megaera polyxenophila TaxID=988779 RepID=UPI00249E771A|nr:hypothetical protein N3Z16_07680 [Candidatus Megaera polyxenophila]
MNFLYYKIASSCFLSFASLKYLTISGIIELIKPAIEASKVIIIFPQIFGD